MTQESKVKHGENIEGFEDVCRELQEISCYESEDWDRVIEIGQGIVKEQFEENEAQEK